MTEIGRSDTAAGDAERVAGMVAAAARHWLGEETAVLARRCELRPALPICTAAGALEGWFVPVVAGDRLAAYLRFTSEGARRGLSLFMQRPGALETCPPLADWLDRTRVMARAQALAHAGERAGEPMLSFDRSPERLAWRVPLRDGQGHARPVFVAGAQAWPGAA